jgi:hypothetical protein
MHRRTRFALASAAAAAAGCALAPAALADSGTITVKSQTPTGSLNQVFLQATVTKDVCDAENCNWYPIVFKVAAGAPCVADTHSIATLAGPETIRGTTGTFTYDFPVAILDDAQRLCLYLSNNGPEQYKLVGQLDYQAPPEAPAPEPSPSPSPSPSPEREPRLAMARARRAVKPILRQEYGRRFASRRRFSQKCRRASASRVGCKVRWIHKGTRYKGTLLIATNPEDANNLRYEPRIRKRRV